MDINHKSCEISFDLDFPIQVASGSGDWVDAREILFRKPNRQTGAQFQNLSSMFNRAMTKSMLEMKSMASEEEIEIAQRTAEAKQSKAIAEPMLKSILNITIADVMEEVEGMTSMATSMDFDFEKGYKLFDRMLLNNDKKNVICEIGGVKVTDVMLDRINYQDQLKMLLVYICFFGKPVKSGTMNESDKQPKSASPATEV